MKEQLVQWLTNLDYGKFFALIIAYISTHATFLAAFFIGLFKTRLSKIKVEELISQSELKQNEKFLKQLEAYQQQTLNALGNVQRELISQNTQAQEKRLEAITNLKEDAAEAIEEIKHISVDDVLETIDTE